ncbi:MAG: iron donor protein CyaY [Gammaproteobacteria bacterium]|nr:iron donor protein CyaY [Gammaproteobacteria bacterium]
MNESEFNALADETIMAIEDAVEASGADIDYDTAGDILTLEFTNGSQIIINKQAPLSQIWVAARSGGFHFDYDAARQLWHLNSDDQKELFAQLSQYCTEQSGESVALGTAE